MYNCEMKQQWSGGNCHDERCENVENVSAGVVQSSATGVLAGWETVTRYSYTFTHMINQGLLHQPGKGPTPTCEANDCLLNRPDFYTEQDKLLAWLSEVCILEMTCHKPVVYVT